MWWALEDSNLRPQPCECGSCLRTGREKTAPNALSCDDHDTGQSATTAHDRSCGAFCGAFLGIEAHLSVVDPSEPPRAGLSACRANTGKVVMATRLSSRSPEGSQRLVDSGDTCAAGDTPSDFSEPELPIEGTCGFVDRIDHDEPCGHLRPGTGGPFDGLDKQISAEPQSLYCISAMAKRASSTMPMSNPRVALYRTGAATPPFALHPGFGEGVIPDHIVSAWCPEAQRSGRDFADLILECVCTQPLVQVLGPAAETADLAC